MEEIHGPYSQRPSWHDVLPVVSPVSDENPTVSIQYSARHKEALGYMFAVLSSGELSERVLHLTSDVIGFNQADYTAWQLRWQCVEALNSSLTEEQNLTENIMRVSTTRPHAKPIPPRN